MIQKNSKIFVIDNSGASVLNCVHIFKKSKIKNCVGTPGTIIVASVRRLRKAIPKKLVIKSKICFAVITSTSSSIHRVNGVTVKGSFNSAIILGKYNKKGIQKNKPGDNALANRFNNSVYYEVRQLGFFKVMALARTVI